MLRRPAVSLSRLLRFEKTEMKAAKVRLLPADFLIKHEATGRREASTEAHLAAVQALGGVAVPRFDGVEVVEFGHAPAGRGEMSAGGAAVRREFRRVKHVSQKHPMAVEFATKNPLAKPGQPVGLVDLVPIHAEYPGGRTREVPDERVRGSGMADRFHVNFRRTAGQRTQDSRGRVGRSMVGDANLVAEGDDIAHCGFDEEVLVADQDDAHNSRRAQRGALPCRSAQIHCLSRSMRITARKLFIRREMISSVRFHEMASKGPPPSSMFSPMS